MNKKKRKGAYRKRVSRETQKANGINNLLMAARAKQIGVDPDVHRRLLSGRVVTAEEKKVYVEKYSAYHEKMVQYKKAGSLTRMKNFISDAYAKLRR